MNDKVAAFKALMNVVYAKGEKGSADNYDAIDAFHALKFTTPMLEADLAEGSYGILTHSTQARELLKLDTEARRQRVWDEAHTLSNLIGGVLSQHLYSAADSLLRNIAEGRESDELYGERTARQYREREQELRQITGNPSAIYYPPGMRR